MEKRLFFVVGDFAALVLAGAAGAALAAFVIGPGWPTILGMVVGMLLGLVMMTPVLVLFSPFFGVFEIFVPSAMAGMAAGMLVGMRASGGELGISAAVQLSLPIGPTVFVVVYVLNAVLTRNRRAWPV